MKTSTKGFTVLAAFLLAGGAITSYRSQRDRWVVLEEPVRLESGVTISRTFTVDRWTSYYLEIECERVVPTEDLEDALIDGLAIEGSVTADGRPIEGVNCSDKHMSFSQTISRVLCTFDARPGKVYDLTLHVIRSGPPDSLNGRQTDETLTVPPETHPTLKVVVDWHDIMAVRSWVFLFLLGGFVCLLPILRFFVLQLFRRRA